MRSLLAVVLLLVACASVRAEDMRIVVRMKGKETEKRSLWERVFGKREPQVMVLPLMMVPAPQGAAPRMIPVPDVMPPKPEEPRKLLIEIK